MTTPNLYTTLPEPSTPEWYLALLQAGKSPRPEALYGQEIDNSAPGRPDYWKDNPATENTLKEALSVLGGSYPYYRGSGSPISVFSRV